MKVYELQGGFGLERLTVAERPIPEPKPGEALVKLRAVSLNPRDFAVINGYYDPKLALPIIPASDGFGTVESVGAGVSRFRPGDRVAAIYRQRWLAGEPDPSHWFSTLGAPLDGLLAEYAVLSEQGLVRVPPHLTDEEAATLPVAGVTAWHAVVEAGGAKAGDTVVLQGTGGVSLFALQFAKLHGARVIVASSSEAKLANVKSLGADEVIHTGETPDWEQAVLKLTEGRGADLVVDVGGGATLNRSVAAARIGGRIILMGLLTGGSVEAFQVAPVFAKQLRIQGISGGSRDMFEAMNRAIAQSGLRPVVGRTFAFEEAREALRELGNRSRLGKIVIRIGSD